MFRDYTDDQLIRFYLQTYRRMMRDLSGGTQFGVSARHLRLYYPRWYNTLNKLSHILVQRGLLAQPLGE